MVEIAPTHFQVPTSAAAAEQEKARFYFCLHTKKSCGQLGQDEVQEWPCGIEMNKKGRMNNNESDCYIENTIMPLCLDMEDKPVKCVLLKVDSGHGHNCMGMDLMCKAHFCCLYIFPSLPNTTSMQQKTDHS